MNKFRSLFTLIEMIVVIVVIGILAAIVIPNTSSVKDDARQVAITSNERTLQDAIDLYMIENRGDIPTEVIPTFGNPQFLDFDSLHPDYIRNAPEIEGANYIVDHLGSLHISMASPPTNVTQNGAHIVWDEVENADSYNVYKRKSGLLGTSKHASGLIEFVENVKENRFTKAEENTLYFVSSIDRYGNETPVSNPPYLILNGKNEYADLPIGEGIDPSKQPLTIEVWAKPEERSSMLIGSRGGTHNRLHIWIDYDGYWDMGIKDQILDKRNTKVKLGEWYHIALTLDGSTAKLYIDGELEKVREYTSYTARDLRLGVNSVGSANYYKGGIKELSIWSVAKTQEEIIENMHKEYTGKEDGLVGYWKLNEVNYEKIIDHGPNKLHGDIKFGHKLKRDLD